MSENPTESHRISSEDELPKGPDTLTFNQGHTQELRDAGLLDQDSLYYIGDSKNPYSSITVEKVLQNKMLTENPIVTLPPMMKGREPRKMHAQNALYEALYQELNQHNTLLDLERLLDGINEGDKISTNPQYVALRLKDYEIDVKNEYFMAQAADSVLARLQGPESRAKIKSRRFAELKLKRDDAGAILDVELTNLKSARGLVSVIRSKISGV